MYVYIERYRYFDNIFLYIRDGVGGKQCLYSFQKYVLKIMLGWGGKQYFDISLKSVTLPMCVYAYISLFIYMCDYTCIYTHEYIYIYIHTYLYIHMH